MEFSTALRAFFVLTVCLASSVLCAQTPAARVPAVNGLPSADAATLRTALEAYDKGDAARAEPALRRLLERYPQNYAANEALGSLYAEAGAEAKALPFLLTACQQAPGQALAHANLGAVYLKLAKADEAVRELEMSAALDPGNGNTQASLGQALMLAGKAGAAVKPLRAAAKLLPADAAIRYDLAFALFEGGSVREAADLLDAMPAASMSAEMHSLAADADEHAGRYALALSNYQAAAQKSPSDANLYALVAELLRHWNWAEAIEVAQFGAAHFPSSVHFKMAVGVAYYGKSEYKAAAEIFSGLLEKDPDNATVAGLLGRSCAAMPDGVSVDCGRIYGFVERHPGNAIMATYAANTLLREPEGKRDLDKAAALLRTAIAADPQLAEAYLSMGTLEQVRLRWKESAAALERAVALRPTMAEAHYRLSRAYAHLGRREEAQEQIALHQKYSKQAKESLDARMQEVMRFILKAS